MFARTILYSLGMIICTHSLLEKPLIYPKETCRKFDGILKSNLSRILVRIKDMNECLMIKERKSLMRDVKENMKSFFVAKKHRTTIDMPSRQFSMLLPVEKPMKSHGGLIK